MKRFKRALGTGFLFTFYIMCFYYAFAVLQALVQGTDVVKAALDSVVVGCVLLVMITMGIYELLGYAEERDKLRDEERKQRERELSSKDSGSDGPDQLT